MAAVEHLVVDASAFLRGAPLQEIGRRVYTTREVLAEIRDRAARRRLAGLPFELLLQEPLPEHVRLVSEFSKQTGDFRSLSAADIQVLALTLQLEAEHGGGRPLRTEPRPQAQLSLTNRHPEAPVDVPGFHVPPKVTGTFGLWLGGRRARKQLPFCWWLWEGAALAPVLSFDWEPGQKLLPPTKPSQRQEAGRCRERAAFLPDIGTAAALTDRCPGEAATQTWHRLRFMLFFTFKPETKCPGNERIPLEAETDSGDPVALAETEFSSFLFWRNPLPNIEEDLEGLLKADPLLLEAEDSEGQESSGEENGKEDGWITPRNIEQIQKSTCWGSEPAKVQVGCITTDFAMQNVLLQMGLHVLAFNGLLIQHARSYILRCHGCFRTTSKMTRLFCPHCGNKTLKKVAVTVKDDGSFHLHFSQNPKVLNPRGLRHSLPAPRGGKHASNPHLTEDQRSPQQRLSRKARQKTNAFDPDYVAGVSPFAEHDIHSRAANLQIRDAALGAGRRRLNPNMSRKKFVKSK